MSFGSAPDIAVTIDVSSHIHRLIHGIESDLKDVHSMISCNEKDYEDKEKLYHSMRCENIDLRVRILSSMFAYTYAYMYATLCISTSVW